MQSNTAAQDVPIKILSYRDAIEYLSKESRFDMTEAIASHLFQRDFFNTIRAKEIAEGRKYTQEELDKFVDVTIGKIHLDEFKDLAINRRLEDTNNIRLEKLAKDFAKENEKFRWFPLYAIWQGFLGNVFFTFIVAVIGLIIATKDVENFPSHVGMLIDAVVVKVTSQISNHH